MRGWVTREAHVTASSRVQAIDIFIKLKEMAFRKRLGYNWKARKNPVKKASQEIVPKVELDDQTGSHPDDTNSLVLPSRKRVSSGADEECIPKRKKLSSKHRKRLQKIVESREKKAKVGFQIMPTPRGQL